MKKKDPIAVTPKSKNYAVYCAALTRARHEFRETRFLANKQSDQNPHTNECSAAMDFTQNGI